MGYLAFGMIAGLGLLAVFGFFRIIGFTPDYIANNEE